MGAHRESYKFESTEYKYVRKGVVNAQGHMTIKYKASLPHKGVHRSWVKICEDIKEAARAVDLKLIERGESPVNILVRR